MRPLSVMVFVFALLAGFAGTALAAGAATGGEESLLELVRPVVQAVLAGQYPLAGALGLVLAVGLAAKYGAARWPFLGTGPGKALLTLAGAFFATIATGLGAGAAFSLGMVWAALGVAVTAAGGYSLIKSILGPLVPKLPAWAQPIARLVMWFFQPKEARAAEAAVAGEAAVAAKPSKGVAGIVGEPRDVP